MNIFDILRTDHHDLLLKLENLLEPNGEDQNRLLRDLQTALLAHGKAEEYVVYDRLRQVPHRGELADQLCDEHQQIDDQVDELMRMGPEREEWDEKLTVLKTEVEAHLAEEESVVFPILEDALNERDAEDLGRDFMSSRDDVLQQQHFPLEKRKAPEGAPSKFS